MSVPVVDEIHLDGQVAGVEDLPFRLAADFTILDSGRDLYREPHFPVAELAIALKRWVAWSDGTAEFEFDSVFAEDVGWVWIRPTASGMWRFASIHQEFEAHETFDFDRVRFIVDDFFSMLDSWCERELGDSLRRFVES